MVCQSFELCHCRTSTGTVTSRVSCETIGFGDFSGKAGTVSYHLLQFLTQIMMDWVFAWFLYCLLQILVYLLILN